MSGGIAAVPEEARGTVATLPAIHNLEWKLSGSRSLSNKRLRSCFPTRSRLFGQLHGVPKPMAGLMYGSGLRVLECAELRVKDLNLDRGEIRVRDGKGRKDRVTMLPVRLREPLGQHLEQVKRQPDEDLAHGGRSVWLPDALATTMVYTHVLNRGGLGVQSPLHA